MSSKELKPLLKELKRQGFEVVLTTKGSHYKVTHPDHPGKMVTLASSPSDHRAIKNSLSYLRAIGFVWRGR